MISYYSNVPLLYSDHSKISFIPGIENYLKLAKYTYPQCGLTDRTGLDMPFHTSYDRVPDLDSYFNLSFVECIMDTMNEIDSIHNRTGKKFRLMYSGGVDSVTIFAAFLDYYGLDSTRKLLEISCSKESIRECPELWNDYIRKYNFDIHCSQSHSSQILDGKIILTGENNDVLFSNMYFPEYTGDQYLYDVPTIESVANFISNGNATEDSIYAALKLFEIAEKSQVPITNNYLFYWYIDFVTIWTGLALAPLAQCRYDRLPQNTTTEIYRPFFMSEKFQQWSMIFHINYPNNFAEQKNYKKMCKDYIYKVLGMENYKNKYKFPSLGVLHTFRKSAYFIDEDMVLYRKLSDLADFIKLKNDFT